MEINLNYIVDSLRLIRPELAISITLVAIVTMDLIMGKNKKLLPYISLIGLLTAFYFVLADFGISAFGFIADGSKTGMIITDHFGSFFQRINYSGFRSCCIVFNVIR